MKYIFSDHQLNKFKRVLLITFSFILISFGICSGASITNLSLSGNTQYVTSLGILKDGFTIMDGETSMSGNNLDIKWGLLSIGKNEGVPVGKNISLFKGKVSTTAPKKIIIIYDKESKKWIATDGVVFMDFKTNEVSVLEGTEITIKDGVDNSITILGKEYLDANLAVRNGIAEIIK